MTDQSSPITPPPELVQQWLCSDDYLWGPLEQTSITITGNRLQNIATAAAQWGWDQRGTINEAQLQERADQELEACIALVRRGPWCSEKLRAARRPKPPSLKEQAIAELEKVDMLWDTTEFSQDTLDSLDTIRRALEAMPNG
jgi:hypothetical protein